MSMDLLMSKYNGTPVDHSYDLNPIDFMICDPRGYSYPGIDILRLLLPGKGRDSYASPELNITTREQLALVYQSLVSEFRAWEAKVTQEWLLGDDEEDAHKEAFERVNGVIQDFNNFIETINFEAGDYIYVRYG